MSFVTTLVASQATLSIAAPYRLACLHSVETPIVSFGRCTRENSIGLELKGANDEKTWLPAGNATASGDSA